MTFILSLCISLCVAFAISVLIALLKRLQEELSERTSILAAKKDELDAASRQWKSRIDKSDADNFSVAGRMQQQVKDLHIGIPNLSSNNKKLPRAKRYKGKDGQSTIYLLSLLVLN